MIKKLRDMQTPEGNLGSWLEISTTKALYGLLETERERSVKLVLTMARKSSDPDVRAAVARHDTVIEMQEAMHAKG